MKNVFDTSVNNGKCENYAFDCGNKAFGKIDEVFEQDMQSKQDKKNQKKSPQQKASTNDKYRHSNSSLFARSMQENQAQKGSVRPLRLARATQVDQNAFYVKRQTCFNCGIPCHIAQNCRHRPYFPYYAQNQRIMPKDNYHSNPMKHVNPKVKPSDGYWNAAKNKRKIVQEQKSVFKTNKP
ncbi:putative transcription factor interactor and regulator CCHC(Zn) family [Helianthus annuus]|nr:putative transcription factor interactor and regulator CCHC(Zn) family [Helianthus annuus]KAJ0951044.1 putative transcription factor interactor and regulator CCHC(Zn) family [Helianthus annuus]